MVNHTWVEKDDLMILFLKKFGVENSPLSKQEIADKIGVSLGSVSYRVGNFKAIDGIGSATNFARLSLQVHKQYSNLSMQELKAIAFA
ncbi:winged helix-turn-helix domain-containing protein [Photobacterium kagoshimensis]|uniref:winged helix-turn-helix domain-containing protein n=1 Tax=Photobacterium kagoshimensis TaxID=2910242 RepID=UPI003D0D6B09